MVAAGSTCSVAWGTLRAWQPAAGPLGPSYPSRTGITGPCPRAGGSVVRRGGCGVCARGGCWGVGWGRGGVERVRGCGLGGRVGLGSFGGACGCGDDRWPNDASGRFDAAKVAGVNGEFRIEEVTVFKA